MIFLIHPNPDSDLAQHYDSGFKTGYPLYAVVRAGDEQSARWALVNTLGTSVYLRMDMFTVRHIADSGEQTIVFAYPAIQHAPIPVTKEK
jgi:hypothetical protein